MNKPHAPVSGKLKVKGKTFRRASAEQSRPPGWISPFDAQKGRKKWNKMRVGSGAGLTGVVFMSAASCEVQYSPCPPTDRG